MPDARQLHSPRVILGGPFYWNAFLGTDPGAIGPAKLRPVLCIDQACGENQKEKKIFYANKVVFGCGTLVTTKLIMDFLNIKKDVKSTRQKHELKLEVKHEDW